VIPQPTQSAMFRVASRAAQSNPQFKTSYSAVRRVTPSANPPYESNGLTTATPVGAKSETFRVTMVSPCSSP
jgi:hypothetical protein